MAPSRASRSRETAHLSRAERNIRWCERYLFIPDGPSVGEPLRLPEFMRQDFVAIYDNEFGPTRRAIISRGRKSAKTTECAFLLLLHLVGPEAKQNAQLYSCAQSRDQAALLFDYASKIVRISTTLREVVHIRDAAKELVCTELGTRFKALSADASTAMGRNPSFTVFDELGQVRGPRSALFESMELASGVQRDPLSIVVSTQSPSDQDLLSILIDDALAGLDPRTVLRLDTAPLHLDPFSEDAIATACPGLNVFMNKAEVLSMAAAARRMPAREAEYRNYVLNQRADASSPFVKPAAWDACNGPVADFEGRECFAGLDLSEANDLTALVIVCRINNIWHVRPVFWLPQSDIADRSRQDRVPYDLWHRQGFLELTPGARFRINTSPASCARFSTVTQSVALGLMPGIFAISVPGSFKLGSATRRSANAGRSFPRAPRRWHRL